MLKSSIKADNELEKLAEYINDYLLIFLKDGIYHEKNKLERTQPHTYFRDNLGQFKQLINSNQLQSVRDKFIGLVFTKLDFLNRIEEILINNKTKIIYAVSIQDTLKRLRNIKEIIKNITIKMKISYEELRNFYDLNLELCLYLSNIQTNITAYNKILNNFEVSNSDIPILFRSSDDKAKNLTIEQLFLIVEFVNDIIKNFFDEYENIFYFNIDSGSPEVEITAKVDISLKFDFNKFFAELFHHIRNNQQAKFLRLRKSCVKILEKELKSEAKNLDKIKKHLTEEDYSKRFVDIHDKYNKLREKSINMHLDNSIKVLEDKSESPRLLEE